MSAFLVKTVKSRRSFTDARGRRRTIENDRPFRTDAATSAELLARGGFRLAGAPDQGGKRSLPTTRGSSSGEAGTPPRGGRA